MFTCKKLIKDTDEFIRESLSSLCLNEEKIFGEHFALLKKEKLFASQIPDEKELKYFQYKKSFFEKEARFFIFNHQNIELDLKPLDLCHTVKKDLNQITPIMYKIDLNNYHLYFAREDELIIHKNINNWPIYNDLLEKTEEHFNMLMDLYLGPFDRFKSISELCLRILRKNTKKPLLEKIQTLHDFYFKE